MKQLTAQPNLVDQVRDAILQEIASGALAPGERLVQEQLAFERLRDVPVLAWYWPAALVLLTLVLRRLSGARG